MKKNERSLYWTLLLYEESETLCFNDFKDKLNNYECLYIKHDKDRLENGELKKIHYHVVLKFKNYKWKSALSDELNISDNYLQPVRNLNNILCYLIHYKEDNKYHYDLSDVKGSANFKDKLNKVIKSIDLSEEDRVLSIIEYLHSCKYYVSFTSLVDFVLKNGLWSDFRRSASIFSKLLDEHNAIYYNIVKEIKKDE